jgi:hypothetical protein
MGAAGAALAVGSVGAETVPTEDQRAYLALATAAGARSVRVSPRPDGGAVIDGVLDGRQFAVAIPKAWNHQGLLFAHGYTMPDSPVAVSYGATIWIGMSVNQDWKKQSWQSDD